MFKENEEIIEGKRSGFRTMNEEKNTEEVVKEDIRQNKMKGEKIKKDKLIKTHTKPMKKEREMKGRPLKIGGGGKFSSLREPDFRGHKRL